MISNEQLIEKYYSRAGLEKEKDWDGIGSVLGMYCEITWASEAPRELSESSQRPPELTDIFQRAPELQETFQRPSRELQRSLRELPESS